MSEELINKIKELEERLNEQNDKIIKLEELLVEFNSCQLCGHTDSLHVCSDCGRKACHYCYYQCEQKNHRSETIIRYKCKWCHDP